MLESICLYSYASKLFGFCCKTNRLRRLFDIFPVEQFNMLVKFWSVNI